MLELFVGDDWAEEHHDVELMDSSGRRLAQARLPEGVAGMARLHAMIAAQLGEAVEDAVVKVGIETDRGPWAQALIAAGYEVFAVNPLQAARYRERHSVSGAKSDKAVAHRLADMVRTDSHQLRPVAGDTPGAEAIKVVARAHKTLIWERTRHTQRLRHALREYFPAALEAFEDLAAPDTLELLSKAPDPASAARLAISQISAVFAECRSAQDRGEGRGDPERAARRAPAPARGCRGRLRRQRAIHCRCVEVAGRAGQEPAGAGGEHLGRHPAARIILSPPGLGSILGARVLGEFGDAKDRYVSAKSRKNYAGTSPITCASGNKKVVMARFVHNDRLIEALDAQAFASLSASPVPGLLRPDPGSRGQAPSGPAQAGQPSGGDPARLPQDQLRLRRDNRLVSRCNSSPGPGPRAAELTSQAGRHHGLFPRPIPAPQIPRRVLDERRPAVGVKAPLLDADEDRRRLDDRRERSSS